VNSYPAAPLGELPADDWWFPVVDTRGGTVPRAVALWSMARRDHRGRVARIIARRRGLPASGWLSDVVRALCVPAGVVERVALVAELAGRAAEAVALWTLGTADVGTRWAVLRRVDRASGRVGRAGPARGGPAFCRP